MSMGGIEDYGSHFSACAYLYPGLVWVLGLFVWVDECVGSPGSAQSFGYKLILGAWCLGIRLECMGTVRVLDQSLNIGT